MRALSIAAIYSMITIGSLFCVSMRALYSNVTLRRWAVFCIIGIIAAAYFAVVHLFACIYLVFQCIDPTSIVYEGVDLKTNGMDLISAYYFSLTTIATVGYGDIRPFSSAAKIFVMGEIISGLLFAVLVFSILADFIRRGRADL
jgi:hypothetical protein